MSSPSCVSTLRPVWRGINRKGFRAAPKAPRLLDQVWTPYGGSTTAAAEEAYVHWIKRFIYFSDKRHSKDLGAAEVTAFLNYLAGAAW